MARQRESHIRRQITSLISPQLIRRPGRDLDVVQRQRQGGEMERRGSGRVTENEPARVIATHFCETTAFVAPGQAWVRRKSCRCND